MITITIVVAVMQGITFSTFMLWLDGRSECRFEGMKADPRPNNNMIIHPFLLLLLPLHLSCEPRIMKSDVLAKSSKVQINTALFYFPLCKSPQTPPGLPACLSVCGQLSISFFSPMLRIELVETKKKKNVSLSSGRPLSFSWPV